MQPDKYGPKTIESFEPLITSILKYVVYDHQKWDDCRQEARIVVWKILKENPDAPRAYVARAIQNRVRNVSQSGLMTGDPGARTGKLVDPLRREWHSLDTSPAESDRDPELLDQPGYSYGSGDSPWVGSADDPASDSRLDAMYVQGVVRRLPDTHREYVVRHFYNGESSRRIKGYYRWPAIREYLRGELKDLAA